MMAIRSKRAHPRKGALLRSRIRGIVIAAELYYIGTIETPQRLGGRELRQERWHRDRHKMELLYPLPSPHTPMISLSEVGWFCASEPRRCCSRHGRVDA